MTNKQLAFALQALHKRWSTTIGNYYKEKGRMNAASFPEKNANEFHKQTDQKKERDHKDATRMTERLHQ